MNVAAYPRVLSLCAGGGGLDLGLRLAVPGARCVCLVENEVTAAAVLVKNMEAGGLDDAPLWTDLRTFDGAAWRGAVDLVIGGYPCQPFSNAGRRLGADDHRHLWPAVERIVRDVQPEWCFFENVGAHLRLGFREVAGSLHALGYRVAATLLTAEEVGAPHRRERLFILAHSRRGAGRESAERGGESAREQGADWPSERSGDVAHRAGVLQREPHDEGRAEPWRDSRSDAGRNGRQLADAERSSGSAEPRQQYQERTEVAAGSGDVGYAGSVGRWQEGHVREFAAGPDRSVVRVCWPPRPNADWRDIPERLWPATVESEVRGVADGLAGGLGRSDQLHILGNGVVPAQAAYALRMLMEALA